LYFIVARARPVAVVFRLGPSRQVEVLTWDLRSDELLAGQWLKGRIYERRCDLSPSGRLLVYFAAKYETGMRTWTAISRPPWLTALALWPKGDAWGGGGLFDGEGSLRLNHRPGEASRDERFAMARSFKVKPLGDHAGQGEDDPIHRMRLERDGWTFVDTGTIERLHRGQSPWVTFDPPIRYRRRVGDARRGPTLELDIEALAARDGPWYVQTARLLDGDEVIRDLGRVDWVDRGPEGALLLAAEGRLSRLDAADARMWANDDLREVADLRTDLFEARVAPDEAQEW
jgi:hypothetical protein